MADFESIINLITQLRTLVEETQVETGLPNMPVPKGINPAPQGSTFDKKSIPSSLSTSEKNRIKEVAEIFKKTLFPPKEAREATRQGKLPSMPVAKPDVDLSVIEEAGKGGGILGLVSNLLSGFGSGGIAASALPILAGFIGAGVLTIAGGFAMQLVMKALTVAKDVDWHAVSLAGKVFTAGLKDLFKMVIDVGAYGLSAVVDVLTYSFVNLADGFLKFRDVQWSDIAKGFTSVGIAVGGILALGSFSPLVALGSIMSMLAGIGLAAVGGGMIVVATGINQLFSTFETHRDIDMGVVLKGIGASLLVLAGLSPAAIVAPFAALAGLGLAAIGAGMHVFSGANEALALSFQHYEQLDPKKISSISFAIGTLGMNMSKYAFGTLAKNLADLFGGSGVTDLMSFADKHVELGASATAVYNLADGFEKWTNIRTDDLAYNLESIADSVKRLDDRKLQRIANIKGLRTQNTVILEKLHGYFVTGNTHGATKDGMIGLTKEILNENRKQLHALYGIQKAISKISIGTEQGGGNEVNIENLDVRAELFPDLTISRP